MVNSSSNVIPHAQARENLSSLKDQILAIDGASKGLADVQAGKVKDARDTLTLLKRRSTTKVVAACVPG